MTVEERNKIIAERDRATEERINKEIDLCNMAYKVRDPEGNVFVFAGLESGGFASYRGNRGSKIIFDLRGLEILEKHIKM